MKYVKLGWLNDCVMSFILFSSVPGLPVVYKQCDTKTVDIVHAYLQNILAKSNSSLASSHIQVSYTSRIHLFLIYSWENKISGFSYLHETAAR